MGNQAHYELEVIARNVKPKVRNWDPAHMPLWMAMGNGIGKILQGVNHYDQVTGLARQPISRAKAAAIFADLSFPQDARAIFKFEKRQPILHVFLIRVWLFLWRF